MRSFPAQGNENELKVDILCFWTILLKFCVMLNNWLPPPILPNSPQDLELVMISTLILCARAVYLYYYPTLINFTRKNYLVNGI